MPQSNGNPQLRICSGDMLLHALRGYSEWLGGSGEAAFARSRTISDARFEDKYRTDRIVLLSHHGYSSRPRRENMPGPGHT
jgi:hypothetical protein